MFWVISAYFNIRNTLLKSGTFLLGHSVYIHKNTAFHVSKRERVETPFHMTIKKRLQTLLSTAL
jgi:hypothetical protein